MKIKKEIIIAVVVLLVVPMVFAYTPVPGSPLANNEHPRLHITPKTLPELRNIINATYMAEYQTYINDVIAGDSKYIGTGDTAHNIFRGMMLHEAFVGLLNLSGFNYGSKNPDLLLRSAISKLQSAVSSGAELNYVTTITYDWTYNAMTPQERESIALDMLDNTIKQNSGGESLNAPRSEPLTGSGLTSSNYMESAHAPYVALPLYGNPNPSVNATASNALDKFSSVFINYGYFDAMNFVGGEGGVSEWLNYAGWHPISHFLLVDGWTTATGENYVAQKSGNVSGNLMKNFPKFLFYAFEPHKYYGRNYYFVHTGKASRYDARISPAADNGRYLGFLSRSLANAGAVNEAGLMSYFLDKYVLEWKTEMVEALPKFLGVPKNYTLISPESYGLSESEWFKRMGVFYARTGFSSPADSVFSAVDSHFIYDGRGLDISSFFSLTKFGELVNIRADGQKRGYGNLNDYTNGYSDNTINLQTYEKTPVVQERIDFENADKGQGNYERGGIEQVTKKDGDFYHVRIDKSLRFNSGVGHTREYVWFPGANPADDSDFLVVYDRAATPSMQPRWVYHVTWKPSANIAPTSSFSDDINDDRIGEIYQGSNIIIKELNSIGDAQDGPSGEDYYTTAAGMHGVAFAKTILPQLAQVEVSRVRTISLGDVIAEQGDSAFKQTRWQVEVLPQTAGTEHKFLNVFQTADANKVSSMTNTQLIETPDMQGTFIERENLARPNFVVLFTREAGINNNAISYTINGNGETRHVISGLKPRAYYNIYDNGVLVESKLTEGDVELWDYKGVAVNIETGVLYFTTNLESEHIITISEGNSIPLWKAYDLNFSASGSYTNPYVEVSFNATLTAPSGNKMKFFGFWDGGSRWKIRVAPTEIGVWSYVTESNDAGLNGESGSFNAIASSDSGFVETDPINPWGWRTSNGEKHFWMSDTCWRCMNNIGRYTFDQFKQYIDTRSNQNFNHIRGYIASFKSSNLNEDTNEGGKAFSNADSIDPGYFQTIDKKIQYANEHNITWDFVLGGDGSTYEGFLNTAERRERYLRYVIARYGAFDVTWEGLAEAEEHGDEINLLRHLGNFLINNDPYNHPRSTHTLNNNKEWANDAWLSWIMYQTSGPNPSTIVSDRLYRKPLINEEFYYEQTCAGDSAHDSTSDQMRKGAWQIATSGGYFSTGNTATYTGGSNTYNSCGLTGTGVSQMRYLYEFFSKIPFDEMAPNQSIVNTGNAFAKQGEVYVVYLSSGGSVNVNLNDVFGDFNARWFNSRDGSYTDIGSVAGGGSRSFSALDGNDWVLYLDVISGVNCSNGIKNQDETGVDCGGVCVNEGKKCGNDNSCNVNGDCVSNNCVGGVCTAIGNVPIAPSNLIVSLIDGIINLFWQDNSGNEKEFIIQRSADGVTWEEVGRVGVDVETWRDESGVAGSGLTGRVVGFFERITGWFVRG